MTATLATTATAPAPTPPPAAPAAPPAGATCASCRFWNAVGDGTGGECRAHPPRQPHTGRITPHGTYAVWLLVPATAWCGEHAPRTGAGETAR
jgi:hypothetical protein